MSRRKTPRSNPIWAEARREFHLREADIKKAKALGLNPQDFGKYAQLDTEKLWKHPVRKYLQVHYSAEFAPGKNAEKKGRARLKKRWEDFRQAHEQSDDTKAGQVIEAIVADALEIHDCQTAVRAYEVGAELLGKAGRAAVAEKMLKKARAISEICRLVGWPL